MKLHDEENNKVFFSKIGNGLVPIAVFLIFINVVAFIIRFLFRFILN